jgi:hypothetical protein
LWSRSGWEHADPVLGFRVRRARRARFFLHDLYMYSTDLIFYLFPMASFLVSLDPISSYLIPSCLIMSHLISFHLVLFHLELSYLESSHAIISRHVSSCFIMPHRVSSCLIMSHHNIIVYLCISHVILSGLVSWNHIPSIASHRIILF